jgi:hypothetical protein
VTVYPVRWLSVSPPDELVEATVEFYRLLRKAEWESSGELVKWGAHRGFERVLWDTRTHR